MLSNISAWWHVVGVLIIVAVLWILPEKHQSVSWTLTGFHNETGWTFLPYVFLMGLLMAQYTFTGYDASAHVSEETKRASIAAPRGIVMSVLVSLIGGFILLFSITAAVQDGSEEGLTTLAASETGLPPAQIFLDSMGSGRGEVPAVHRLRRPVLLRHGLGHGELADDLRLLPRQRAARARGSGPRSTPRPVRRPTRSGCASCCRSCWPARLW